MTNHHFNEGKRRKGEKQTQSIVSECDSGHHQLMIQFSSSSSFFKRHVVLVEAVYFVVYRVLGSVIYQLVVCMPETGVGVTRVCVSSRWDDVENSSLSCDEWDTIAGS